jgi:hypothetical protein
MSRDNAVTEVTIRSLDDQGWIVGRNCYSSLTSSEALGPTHRLVRCKPGAVCRSERVPWHKIDRLPPFKNTRLYNAERLKNQTVFNFTVAHSVVHSAIVTDFSHAINSHLVTRFMSYFICKRVKHWLTCLCRVWDSLQRHITKATTTVINYPCYAI